MSTKFELVVSGSGLEPERQLEIRAAFEPFAVKLQDWSGKVAGVTDPKIARETRLAMRRERIDLEKQHEAFKSKTLAWTRAVDGSRRVITEAYDQLEAQMADVEKAEERRIAAAKAALKAERDAALRQFGVDVTYIQTGEMTDAAFLAMLEQAKLAHEAKQAAAAKAEADRIEREKREAEERAVRAKAEAEERERVRIENERLRAEAAAAAARAEEERKKAQAEREAAEAAARKEREAAEATLRAEREARAKLEREAAARAEEERKKAEALAAEQRRLAAAPDAAKIHAWAESIAAVPVPTLSTKEAQDLAQAITAHLTKTIANMHARAAQMEDAQ